MIDLSNVKTPGWARIVAELHAPSPDDRTFLHKLTAILAQVAGARQSVLLAVESGEGAPAAPDPRPLIVWPPPAQGQQQPEVLSSSDILAAARSAADSGQLCVFGLERSGSGFYEEQEQGSIVAVPVNATGSDQPAGAPRFVITLLIEQRSRQALQTTTALVEVLAGYGVLHSTRQMLRRTRAGTASLDLAGKLIAAINSTPSFKGAAFQLVNDLTRQVRADRVALGWVQGIGSSGAIRAVAVSDTEFIDRRMAMIQKIEAAMDECLDQEQAVLYPPPPAQGDKADVLLAQAITHAHRELAASDARLKVVSVPLRSGDEVVGVVTIESAAEGPADIASIELVQSALDLVAPVLVVRRSDDRHLAARAYMSAVRAGKWLVGPRHTAWKLAGLALFTGLILAAVVRVPYRVEAPMELRPRTRFVVSVPFEGTIASLPKGIEAGRIVKKGDVLVEMDTTAAVFRRLSAQSQLVQAQTEADAHHRAGKLAEKQQAEARAEQARAELGQADYELSQARVLAPIDGTIIAGDLMDKVGASVKLGDPLFQVAPLDDMVVVAQVSDRDIAMIRADGEGGATLGQIATRADPAIAFPFRVERIVPLAQPKDGRNAFEVRGRLEIDGKLRADFERAVRPGMEGIAKLDTGRRSLLWIGSRRILDQLRLWLWW